MHSHYVVVLFSEAAIRDVLKNDVLENFLIFTGEYLCWILFLTKLQTFRPAALLRDSNTGYFPVNIVKFFRTPILKKF